MQPGNPNRRCPLPWPRPQIGLGQAHCSHGATTPALVGRVRRKRSEGGGPPRAATQPCAGVMVARRPCTLSKTTSVTASAGTTRQRLPLLPVSKPSRSRGVAGKNVKEMGKKVNRVYKAFTPRHKSSQLHVFSVQGRFEKTLKVDVGLISMKIIVSFSSNQGSIRIYVCPSSMPVGYSLICFTPPQGSLHLNCHDLEQPPPPSTSPHPTRPCASSWSACRVSGSPLPAAVDCYRASALPPIRFRLWGRRISPPWASAGAR